MTRIISATIAFLALLAVASLVGADDAGWTQRGQYWYYSGGSDAYTRTVTPGYYYCGVWYPAQTTYTFSHAGSAAPALKLPTYSANWRSEAVGFIKEKQDRAEFAAFMSAMGHPLTGYASGYNLGNATGSTAYQYEQTSTFYGDSSTALALSVQGLAQLGQSQQNGIQSTAGLLRDTATTLGQSNERVASLLALREILKSLDGNKTVIQERSTTFKTGPNVNPAWATSAGKCVNCHSGDKLSGNFDVGSYWTLPAESRLRVVQRLTLPRDHAQRMPKGGEPLSAAELSLWLHQ